MIFDWFIIRPDPAVQKKTDPHGSGSENTDKYNEYYLVNVLSRLL